jgi:Uncharacterised nucleotidyltransferase
MNSGVEWLAMKVMGEACQGNRREVARMLLANRTRFNDLAQWYVRERLGVSVYSLMCDCGLKAIWPNVSIQLMQDQYEQQQVRTARLMETLRGIDVAFREAGVEYLLLKGLPLAERFYGGIRNRFTWDLDILVRPDSLNQASKILDGLGVNAPGLSRAGLWLAKSVTHALEFCGEGGVSIDLHWAFRRLPGVRFPSEEVFGAGRRIEFGGGSYPVPSDEHMLVQLLLSIAADVDRGRCRWRALWDTYLVLEQMPLSRWESFLEDRASEGCLGIISQATAIVVHSMGVSERYHEVLDRCERRLFGRMAMLGPEDSKRLLSRSPNDFRNHLAFARWQEVSGLRYWGWWGLSLPARAFFARRL